MKYAQCDACKCEVMLPHSPCPFGGVSCRDYPGYSNGDYWLLRDGVHYKVVATEAGIKHDQEKPRTDLIPPSAILEVARVLGHGAKKYAPDNWKKVPDLRSRYLGAALRHIFQSMEGQELDPDSGMDHLAHAVCSLLFVMEAKKGA